MPAEYFAVRVGDKYVEMHNPRRVGQPIHPDICPSCLTADIAYATYLQDELRLWDEIDSTIERVELSVRTAGSSPKV